MENHNQVCVSRITDLVANPTVRDIMSRIYFSHMHNNTEQVVGARPSQLIIVLGVRATASRPVRVRQHVQLQGELHLRLDLCCPLVAALFVLEPLL